MPRLSRRPTGRSASNRVVELGRATAALGDRARARPYLQSVVDETRAPDGVPLTDGAVALALLGRPDEAVRAADEAIRLVPESRDAVNGPTVAVQRAWVLIRSEEHTSE